VNKYNASEWMTVKEVCEYLKISKESVYRYIKKEYIPHYRIGERGIRFYKKELDTWMLNKLLNNKEKK